MNEWIKEKGRIEEIDLISLMLKEYGYSNSNKYVAFFTDKLDCGYCDNGILNPKITDIEHLLDIRIFSQDREFRATRSQIGNDFVWRIADDSIFKEKLKQIENKIDKDFEYRTFKENNYLDIDSKKNSTLDRGFYNVTATGGGSYSLPVDEKVTRIITQSYLNYSDNDGSIIVADWRIVGFE